jgi:hypothetical protein
MSFDHLLQGGTVGDRVIDTGGDDEYPHVTSLSSISNEEIFFESSNYDDFFESRNLESMRIFCLWDVGQHC